MEKTENIITDQDIKDMIDGIADNGILRGKLCGKDISKWDLSKLSIQYFKKLSFSSKTQFSDEKEKKFKPYDILEKAKSVGKETEELHQKGITGKGIEIAVIDTNINRNLEILKDIEIIDEFHKEIPEEEHGITVLDSLRKIVPESKIFYYPYNKESEKKQQEIKKIVKDIIQRGIKIISISTNIQKDKEINELCKKEGITLIDSETFYRDFTYCFRNIDEETRDRKL